MLTDEFDLRKRTQEDIIVKISDNFGAIEETSIPQALALNIKGNTEYVTQMNLGTRDIQAVWENTVESIKLAIQFVRNTLGVKHVEFLPYDGMLPVLAHYFYYGRTKSIASHAHREQIERWFWRVAFSERYSGASQTRMSSDAAWIRDLIDRNTPYEESIITVNERALIDSSMRNTTSAVRNGILCLLNLLRPLHFVNASEIEISGEHFSRFTRAEKHHIFPAGFLRRQNHELRLVHRVPNFCFIPSELNHWIGDQPPSVYMQELRDMHADDHEFRKVMKSHLIPVDENSGIWIDDYELFLAQRARMLMDEIRIRCGVTQRVEPEQRNPIVDQLEISLRDLIHDVLLAKGANYWDTNIPSDIQRNVTDRIELHIRKTPGAKTNQFQDPRSRLDFCDISDYPNIIFLKSNWTLFAPIFRHRGECERMLMDLREFRNAVKHNREIDSILDHKAQAAILWLSQALELDLRPFGL